MAKCGLISLWQRKYELKGNDCLNPLLIRSGSIKKIEMEHLFDCFFLLIFGLFISGLFFILENILQNKLSLKRQNILHLWKKVLTAGTRARQFRRRLWRKLLNSSKVLTRHSRQGHQEEGEEGLENRSGEQGRQQRQQQQRFDSEKRHIESVNYLKSHHWPDVNTLAQIRRAQRLEQHYRSTDAYYHSNFYIPSNET